MRPSSLDGGIEILQTVFTVLASGVMTLLGLGAEYTGIQNLLHEQAIIGIWLVFVGTIVLYMGVVELGLKNVFRPQSE